MSDFIEPVDDMIARHFSTDAMWELERSACEVKNREETESILKQLIRRSIAHARAQDYGRNTGTMTFEQAMESAHKGAAVTRPEWDIFLAVRVDEVYESPDEYREWVHYFRFDNTEGSPSGDGWPYKPSDEDRAATDWMLYQSPEDNWVELDFS